MTETKNQKQKALITLLLLSQVRAISQYCRRAWQKVTAANNSCEQYKVSKMMAIEKFQKPEALITLLLSQVRASSQYCRRAWQRITASNSCCEQYKANLKLNVLLTTHNVASAH
jgi:hypothetical protein